MPVIDAHVHVLDSYPPMAPFDDLGRPDRMLYLLDECRVDRALLVPVVTDFSPDNNAECGDLARERHPVRGGDGRRRLLGRVFGARSGGGGRVAFSLGLRRGPSDGLRLSPGRASIGRRGWGRARLPLGCGLREDGYRSHDEQPRCALPAGPTWR